MILINREALENAQTDLETIENVVNSTSSSVNTRLGGSIKTLHKVINDLANSDVGAPAVLAAKNQPIIQLMNISGSNAYTCDAPNYHSQYANNQIYLFVPTQTNSGANPTLSIGGLSPLPFRHIDGALCSAGDLRAGRFYVIRVSGSADRFQIVSGYTIPNTPLNEKSQVPASTEFVHELLKTPTTQLRNVTGTNSIVATTFAPYTNYATGDMFMIAAESTNTGPVTLNINNLGNLPITDYDGDPLLPGDFVQNRFYFVRVTNNSEFRIIFRGVNPRKVLHDSKFTGESECELAGPNSFNQVANAHFVSEKISDVESALASSSIQKNIISRSINSIEGASSFTGSLALSKSSYNNIDAYKLSINAGQVGGKYLAINKSNHPELFSSERISMSVLFLFYTYANGNDRSRILLQQINEGAEITSARQEYSMGNEGIDRQFRLKFANIPLNQNCDEIRIFFDFINGEGSEQRDVYFRELYLGAGPNAAYKPQGGLGDEQLETIGDKISNNTVTQIDSLHTNILNPWEFPDKGSQHTIETASDGTPLLVCSASASASDFMRWDRSLIKGNSFNGGFTLYATSIVSGRVLFRQFDEGGTEIRDLSDGNGDYRYEWDIPGAVESANPQTMNIFDLPIAPTCKTMSMWVASGSSGDMKVGRPWISSSAKKFTPYAPTILKLGKRIEITPGGMTASQAVGEGASTIIVNDGVYTAAELTLDGDNFMGVDIIAKPGTMPKVRGGDPITGFNAVGGLTNVYSASCQTQPGMYDANNPKGFVFCFGLPYSEIQLGDRHPAHHGRSHRLPHFPLFAGPTTVNELESATQPSWYYDATAKVLYVNSVPGVDPLSMTIYVPKGYGLSNGSRRNNVGIEGLTYEFMGLKFDNMGKSQIEGVNVIGSPIDGLSVDKVNLIDRYCSVVGSSNDNWNGHGTYGDTPGRQDGFASIDYFSSSYEPYSAWAWDDGRSLHERGRGRVDGGLMEFNGSTGCAPAGGAEESYYNLEVRSCGWDVPEQGGIAVVNAVSDDGTGCIVNCHNVIVRDCQHGFAVASPFSSHRLNLFNTKSFGCSVAGIHAAENSVVNAHNHYDYGSAAAKAGTGTINVNNGTLVS
ncbi:hypothetical protein KUL42_32440 [Alteromonas sp. KUL42]|uniref:hypothetical protein n=1 Tax=Alteromonas sp. KUL42 TaxID=2480797 RepID=UPI001036D3E4|nr:hypothetical protein [Alteromonas sp. KUL42]TAP33264.1 hypothetical protein EYR97_15280 [Alteromonas sp. KUL42]GEA08483.1 hypothetical protein KUL42_32440 [Alteromonas sp. KUL42]